MLQVFICFYIPAVLFILITKSSNKKRQMNFDYIFLEISLCSYSTLKTKTFWCKSNWCYHVSTIVWLHNLKFKKVLGEKNLMGITQGCWRLFWTNLGSNTPHGSNRTAAVQPLTSHLTNHPSKMSKTCWRSRDKLISKILLASTHGYRSVGQPISAIELTTLTEDELLYQKLLQYIS